MKEVEMIASFDIEGTLRPHKLRLKAEDESLVVINILSVLYEDKDIAYRIIKYRCECTIQGRIRTVDLFYYYNKMKWYLEV